jgi:hypothetical protein
VNGAKTNQVRSENFAGVLVSSGRSREIPEAADVYGWLVGSWELEVLHYRAVNLVGQGLRGEAHFSWALEGRAIQDVWIMPRFSERSRDSDHTNNMFGTTLRLWDPAVQAWHIRWVNPVSGHEERQTGRRVGDEIVQVGSRLDGTATRWRFTEITPNSFHWLGEALEADGRSWKLEGEFRAHRLR